MSVFRHDMFNIGPMGMPIANPHHAEALNSKRLQADLDQRQQDNEYRNKSLQMKAMQELLALKQEEKNLKLKRDQDLEDWNRDYNLVTKPQQQLDQLKFAQSVRAQEQESQFNLAREMFRQGDNEAVRSFKERAAIRERKEKLEDADALRQQTLDDRELDAETETTAHERALELKELELQNKRWTEEFKGQQKTDKEDRDRTAREDKERESALTEARSGAHEDETISAIVDSLSRGDKPDLSGLGNISRESFLHDPDKLKFMGARLAAAFLQYKKIMDQQFDYEGKKSENEKVLKRSWDMKKDPLKNTPNPLLSAIGGGGAGALGAMAGNKLIEFYAKNILNPEQANQLANQELDKEYKAHQEEMLNMLREIAIIPGVREYIEAGID